MLKNYFIDLFNRFKQKNIILKALIILFILLELFICFISFYKVNYIIDTPGTLAEASNTISIDTKNERGHVLTVSITKYTKVSLIKYWLAKADKRMMVEEIPDNYNANEEYYYSYYAKRVSMYNAIIFAYNEAKKVNNEVNIIYTYKGLLVAQVSKNAKTTISTDDVITEIDGKTFNNYNEFKDIYHEVINNHVEGDVINFKVIRIVDNKEQILDRYATLQKNDETGNLTFGFYCFDYNVPDSENSTPKFKIDDNAYSSTGNSGGAMMALSIYNALISDDITNGLIVAGTGTIDIDGNVGAIGGIEQKVVRAKISQVDVFFVDSSDYDDAIKACEKFGYDSSFIVKVTEFSDILDELNRRRIDHE